MKKNITNNCVFLIINYKSEEVVFDAIASSEKLYNNPHYFILDNGSTEESYSNLLSKSKDINHKIFRSPKNIGFPAGMNMLIQEAKKSNFEYAVLLNPDAILVRDFITDGIQAMVDDNSISVISPLIEDNNKSIWFAGGTIDFHECQLKAENYLAPLNIKNYYETDFFNGCLCLFNLNHFDNHIRFDDSLFMYFDEAMLSMKLKAKGLKVVLDNQVACIHNTSFSLRSRPYLKHYYIIRNHLKFFSKYSYKNNLKKYFKPIRISLYYLKRLNIRAFAVCLKAIYHFKKKQFGPYK